MPSAKPAVFVFTTSYRPFIGGAEIAIREVTRRLKGDVDFFIFTARFRRDLPRRESRPEGVVIRSGIGSGMDKWLFLIGALAVAWRERRRLGRRAVLLWGVDISAGSGIAAVLNFLLPALPFVLTIQYGYGDERIERGRLGMIRLGFRFMLRRADSVTAISTYLAGVTRRYGYRGPIAVIPNGVPVEQFRARARQSSQPGATVITVSRLVPKNGVDTLIRAIAALKPDIPHIRCHILGDGPERERLEALARSLGVEDAVRFFGSVPYEALPSYLAAADVFARPSRSEGMGNAFVEALAAGLPIIGTPVGGIADIIEDGKTGFFARVDDPADVAEKIETLLEDRALRERIAAKGLAMVKARFSWDGIAASYAAVFGRARQRLRLLIATPQFPPDIGGPGAYASALVRQWMDRGHGVSILAYGSGRSAGTAGGSGAVVSIVPLTRPSGIRQLIYAWRAFRRLAASDVALVLDPIGVGVPLAIVCRLWAKPMIIRVEGDRLWESYVERSSEELTLRQFSERIPKRLSRRERMAHLMARWTYREAERLVFSSRWREEIFRRGYPLRPEQSLFIPPPWPHAQEAGSRKQEASTRERVFLFAGRFIKAKNLERLIRAFLAAAPDGWRLELIGDGPERKNLESGIKNQGLEDRVMIRPPLVPQALRERIESAHAFVLPSLSDVSPNVILDCIEAGTPFLLTKETGFYEMLKDVGLFVDPLDDQDIAAKLRLLLDPQSYAACRERLAKFSGARPWDAVADDWLHIIHAAINE